MAKATKAAKENDEPRSEAAVAIPPPNFQSAEFNLIGTAPLVINRFANKGVIMETQRAGSAAKNKRKRDAKDFESLCDQAAHRSTEGWAGIHAAAFRNAMISACRVAGFAMTKAKLSVFVNADGVAEDGTPLVRIQGGDYEQNDSHVRNETGVIDIRSRPMWREWSVTLRVTWDGDQFTLSDVANLLQRAGLQVGIGEGRPDSKKSNGCGWGTFRVA